ncbi:hypothetical protein, partial [Enterobacter hormaechei]|uniref:hypothetical protein n=1 Tax=Enterobacter hormaechei TaxID=158836 RepID=UPI0029DA4955
GIVSHPSVLNKPSAAGNFAPSPKPRFFIHHGHDCPCWPFSAVQSEMTMLDKMVASFTTFLWAKNHANRLREGVNK